MISLAVGFEDPLIELECGVKLLCKPYTTYIYELAKITANTQVDDLMKGKEILDGMGCEIFNLPDEMSLGEHFALGESMFKEALAIAAVVDWEGLGLADGTPIEFDKDVLRQLMRLPDVADEFVTKYKKTLEAFIIEGKA